MMGLCTPTSLKKDTWRSKDWKDGKPSQVLLVSHHQGCKCIVICADGNPLIFRAPRFGPTVPTTVGVSWHHMIWWCSPRPTRTYPLPKRRAFGTDGLTDFFFQCFLGATNAVIKSSQYGNIIAWDASPVCIATCGRKTTMNEDVSPNYYIV